MERRTFVRLHVFSTIRLSTAEYDFIFHADLLDISKGGVCVANIDREKLESFSIMQEFDFELMIGTEQVSGVAMIAWLDIERSCIGMKFVQVFKDEESTYVGSLVNSGF